MKLASIFWFIIAGAIFSALNLYLTLAFFDGTNSYFPLIIALITCFFLFLGLYNIGSVYQLSTLSVQKNSNKKGWTMVLLLFMLPVLTLVSKEILVKRVDEALINNGVIIKVKKNTQITRSLFSMKYKVDFEYQTPNGRKYLPYMEVDEKTFSKIVEKENLEIVYSKEHPSIFRLLLEENELKKYAKIENRNLNCNDLIGFMNVQPNKRYKFLRKISADWNFYLNENVKEYLNPEKKEQILIPAKKSDTLIYSTAFENKKFFDAKTPFKKTILPKDDPQVLAFSLAGLGEIEAELYESSLYSIKRFVQKTATESNYSYQIYKTKK